MHRWLKILLPILALAVGGAVVLLLHHELRQYDYATVVANLRAVSHRKIAVALGLTVVSYALLVCYDALALHLLGRSPGLLRTAFASFSAYVLSYNIGLSVISGTAVRFRLYSAWGYGKREIARIVTFTSLTFWMGLLAAAGLLLAVGHGQTLPGSAFWTGHLRAIGFVLLAVVVAYLVTCCVRRAPLTIKAWTLQLPPLPTAMGQ